MTPEILLKAADGDPVSLTQALVATPSVNPSLDPDGAGEGEVARVTCEWLAAWGYEPDLIEVAPGRFNVVGTKGGTRGKGKTLLLNGHLDTVGVAGMTTPFEAHNDGTRIWGRGAADMKSGNACILATAAALRDASFPGRLVVAFTADEEHASLGMEALARTDASNADFAVVCEPTSLNVMPAHKGFAWFNLEVTGRAAHGSRPDIGIDAIAEMGYFLRALEAEGTRLRSETRHPLLGPASIHAGVIEGGTAASVYPERCRLSVERRTLPGETAEDVLAEMTTLLKRLQSSRKSLDLTCKADLFRAGTEVPADHPGIRHLVAACRDAGVGGDIEGMSAWVDACYLNQRGVPAVCFGPGSIAQAHTTDEWVAVSEVEAAARILTAFTRDFIGG